MGELDRIAIGEVGQILRELLGSRHAGALHEHRDDGDVTLQRGGRFEPHEIHRIIEPPPVLLVSRVEPALADHRQQHATRGHVLVDGPTEIPPRLDPRHIHEDRVLAKLRLEVIEEAPGLTFGVLPAIADEDGAHRAPP